MENSRKRREPPRKVFHRADIDKTSGTLSTLAELRREYETQIAGYKLQVGLLTAERDRYYQLLTTALCTPKEVKLINAGPRSIVATDGSAINIDQHVEYITNLRDAVAALREDSPTFAKVAKNTALDIIGGVLKDIAKGEVKKAAGQIIELGKELGPLILDTAAHAFFRNIMMHGG